MDHKARCLALALLLALGMPLLAENSKPVGKAGSVQEYTYKVTPKAKLSIHVHFPKDWKATDQRPALVFFFGGGWRKGSVKQFTPQAEYLAKRGLVTARADYRVKSRHGVSPDQCVEDCKSAVRWLRQHAANLGIDPKRIAAGGGSAGGHTAAATFTTTGLEAKGEDSTVSSKPNLLALFNPALDATIRKDRFPSEELARRCSPNHNLTRDVPATILFFGTDDELLAEAKDFLARANKLGIVSQLYTAQGQRHGFFNRPPWLQRTLYQLDLFLAEQGYLKGKPTIKASPRAKLTLAGQSPSTISSKLPGTWQGTWEAKNKKHGGELRCVVRQVKDSTWEARFTGYCNRRFVYEVRMKGQRQGAKVLFKGKADLGKGEGIYHWTGTLQGKAFTGKYVSEAGKKGNFTLKPAKSDSKAK